jgi:tetratricopeptide (TPR) repeat protein
MKKQFIRIVALLMGAVAVVGVVSSCTRNQLPEAPSSTPKPSVSQGTPDQKAPSGGERLTVRELYDRGQFLEAYEKAKAAVEDNKKEPQAWLWLGITARQTNRYEEALDAYNQALTLKPDYPEAYNNMGDLYERQERWREAIAQYEKAMSLNPDLAAPYAGLGDIYRKNGAWDKAVKYYEEAVKRDPQDALSQEFIKPCKQASGEAKTRGFVGAGTLGRLTQVEPEVRSRAPELKTRGLAVRSLEEPPDTPRLAMHLEFRRDKYALADFSENGRKQLEETVKMLASSEWQGKQIAIEGYACSCGEKSYGKWLAQKRAETVRDYLIKHANLSPENVFIIAHGEDNPVADTGDEDLGDSECEMDEKHSMNRRVVIREWRGQRPPGNPNPGNPDPPSVPPRASAKVSFWWRPVGEKQFRRLKDGEVLHSGDEFKIFMLAYHPVYAYVFHHGSADDWVRLFPNEKFCKESPASNPLQPERKYWLPRFGEGMQLDDVTGTEETFVYISSGPDLELEKFPSQPVKKPLRPKPPGPSPVPPPPPDEEVEEVVKIFVARGVSGVTAEKAEDIHLPANWYARVRFEHR